MPARDNPQLPTGTVTFLFTDIEGSTRLLSALGDRYAAVLERQAALMRRAIAGHGGAEVSTQGDSFFAVFPSAIGALNAVIDAQRALGSADWPTGVDVKVRMGLHSGEGRLGGDNYVGMDVHVAARIAAAGHGGQVLISPATRVLVEDALPSQVSLRDLGQHQLKDLTTPVRLSQVDVVGLRTEFPPLKSSDARSDNLPEPLSTFMGREREVASVGGLLERRRLVTLTGPGGSGKTRLVQEVARRKLDRFSDGVTFVDLAVIRDPNLVPMAISQALRLQVDPGGDPISAVIAHLRDRQLLLLLDNFEQVVGARSTVERLLAEAPAVKVLITSRQPLGLYGEQEYPLPPLRSAEATDLFVDRARAVNPDFAVSASNQDAVAAIVEHVAGLPLAIELAASQIRVLSPSAVRARIEQHLPLPSAGDGRPERLRTMHSAIEWSYELLDESERGLFARLAVFPGGFSIPAAETVAGDVSTGSVFDGIAALAGKSLIRPIEMTDGDPRFEMLEPIREYAEERLRVDFDADGAARRLAAFCLDFAEAAAPHLTTQDQLLWLDQCEHEAPNVRRALDWAAGAGEIDLGLRIATALWRYWQQRGPLWEGRRFLDQLLETGEGAPAIRGRALGAAGGLAWWDGDFAASGRRWEEALPLVEKGPDRLAEADALYDLGFAELWQAVLARGGLDADRAEGLFTRSLAIAEELGDRRAKARALRGLGQVLGIARGDAASAVPGFRQSLALAEEIGDRWEMNESVVALGNGLRFSGDLSGAKNAYLKGIDLMAEAANRQTINGLLYLLSALESQMGNHGRVARLWGATEAARKASGAIAPPSAARLIGDPIAAARVEIGDAAVERGLAEGAAMDLDGVVRYAHANSDA